MVWVVFAVTVVVVICVGVLFWRTNKELLESAEAAAGAVEARGAAMVPETLKEMGRRIQIVKTLCANKAAILVYTFQVIYQYASIVTGYEFQFDYPEPAKSAVEFLSAFGLNLLGLAPPECEQWLRPPTAEAAFGYGGKTRAEGAGTTSAWVTL